MRVFLFKLAPRHTSFVYLEAGEIKNTRGAQSLKYYPNTTFVNVYTYCSS